MIAVVFEGCACRAAFHAGVAEVLVNEGVPIGIAAGALYRDAARDLRSFVRSSRSEADFVTAVLGSCFFPVLYGRSVRVDGELVIDGGVTDNLPVAAVVARGATTVLAVVPAFDGTALARPLKPRVRPEAVGNGAHVITIKPARPLAVKAWDLTATACARRLTKGGSPLAARSTCWRDCKPQVDERPARRARHGSRASRVIMSRRPW